jgi:hypothetical protein
LGRPGFADEHPVFQQALPHRMAIYECAEKNEIGIALGNIESLGR